MDVEEAGGRLVAETVGERVALLMHRRGLSISELADLVGVHRNTISNILNDRLLDDPKEETIRGVARELGVEPGALWPTSASEASGGAELREKAGKMKPTDTDGRRGHGTGDG